VASIKERKGMTIKRNRLFRLVALAFFFSVQCAIAESFEFKKFDEWASAYVASDAAGKIAMLADGVILAKAREESLFELIKNDPRQALKNSLEEGVLESLPPEIKIHTETLVGGVGLVSVVGGTKDSSGKIITQPSYKVVVDGQSYVAHLYGKREGMKTRDNIPLHGIALRGHLALHESPVRQSKNGTLFVGQEQRELKNGQTLQELEAELNAEPQETPGGLGAKRPAKGEEKTQQGRKIKKIGVTAIGQQRIKEAYEQRGRGLPDRFKGEAPQVGQELQFDAVAGVAGVEPGSAGAVAPTGVGTESAAINDLPSGVDNSKLKYWRSIFNQSGGSCCSASVTGYQMTYMVGIQRDWDVNASNDRKFSPYFTYNMVNDGVDEGSNWSETYGVLEDHGACTETDWGTVSGVGLRKWPYANADIWRRALRYKTTWGSFSISGSSYDAGMLTMKQLLANGYVMTFGCDVNGFQSLTIPDDPNTSKDDGVVGQKICHYAKVHSSGHSMTIVGYNDDIWCDINQNGFIDPGEKGAVKYANSWGTGGYWNSGYGWMSYDALKAVSEVSGWIVPADRTPAFWGTIYWTVPRIDYTPRMVAVMQVKHKTRDDMTLYVGKGNTDAATPSTTFTFDALSGDGGAYCFDGNTNTDLVGNFVLDMEGVSPDLNTQKRYFLSMQDASWSTATGLVSAFWLEDSAGNVLATASNTPLVANNSTAYSWVDFSLTDIQSSTVSVSAAVADVYEGTNAPGVFVVSRTGSTATNLYVNLSVSGTADKDDDFLPLPCVCTIPAGQTSSTIHVVAMEDERTEGNETVIVTLQPGLAYAVSGGPATVTIHEANNGLPPKPASVAYSVLVPKNMAVPETGSVQLPVRLNRSPLEIVGEGNSVTVVFSDNAWDPELNITGGSTSIVFTAANWDQPQFIKVTAANDADTNNGYEHITMTGPNGYSDNLYVYEQDNDITTVFTEFDQSMITVPEGGTNTFKVRLKGNPGTTQTVNLYGGNTDISIQGASSFSFNTNNWNAWQTVTVKANEDTDTTDDVAVLYGGNSPSARIAVVQDDNDAASASYVSIACAASAAEPASNGLFRVSRAGVTNTALTVYLFTTGSATPGIDYTTLPTNITFSANEVAKTVPITVINDSVFEGDELVKVYIISNVNYQVAGWSAEAVIYDDENTAPVVTNRSVNAMEDTLLAWNISVGTAYDTETTNLTYTVITMPTHGTLGGGTPNLTYMPDADWNGTDSFILRVSDGSLSTQVVYQIVVQPVNDAPVVTDNKLSAENDVFLSGVPISLQYTVTDIDGGDSVTNMAFMVGGSPAAYDRYDGNNVYTQAIVLVRGSYSVKGRALIDGAPSVDSAATTIRVVDPVAAPWIAADVGGPGKPGTSGRDGTKFVVAGSGNITGTSDKFQYCYRLASGDGEMIARITSFENNDNNAEAGIMVRSSLNANARFAFSRLLRSSYKARFETRITDGSTAAMQTETAALTLPRWLKLVKSGDLLTAYHSSDGINWISTGRTNITLSSDFYVGLAVAAYNNAELCTAEFDNVSTSFQAPPPPVTVSHAVPHTWLSAINPTWSTNYEAAALADPDHDGFSTWQEYWSGTDPQDSNSCLRIDSIMFSGTNLLVSWRHAQVDAGIPPITIQARSNLVSGLWVGIGSHAPTNGVNIWSAGSSVQGFYRLAVTNAP
jgi:Bacterial Ig domain/Calx-beta domain